ncbi:hypothetical protein RM574_24895 [Streptomyces sp. DSM 41982]|uniref:Uncharacterized protein n=1 Tax=Streptomyces evansiae TaxID=3075535 RepID=A0ABD5ECC2_9ACTN|nr:MULTISPECIES: hypothetical protein [unclassified Streptomyces]MDT0418721.1 hypothetical protein [Streptomyces sp. DSM 41982]
MAVAATTLFALGAGSAVAASWHSMKTLTTGGAAFRNGQYTFYPKSTNHGGFGFKGGLADTSKGDGHNVYVQAKVEGYSWRRFNGKQGKTVRLNKVVYDGAAQYVRHAALRVCRDRGSLRPDNCSPTRSYKGPDQD